MVKRLFPHDVQDGKSLEILEIAKGPFAVRLTAATTLMRTSARRSMRNNMSDQGTVAMILF